MLDSKLAQMIVDRMMSVLDVTVNIMDENGTVIAAGSKNRIGGFHMAAAEVIKTGKKKAVTAEEAKNMEGVLCGITLPIRYKNKIIGAIGMTGDPETVEPYGEIVAMTAVLMIEQEENRQRAMQRHVNKESFLLDLIRNRGSENEDIFLQRARNLKFDLDKNRVLFSACVVTDDANEKAIAIRELRNEFHNHPLDDGGPLDRCFVNDSMVFLQVLERSSQNTRNSKILMAQKILNQLRNITSVPILICIGNVVYDWHDVPGEYNIAKGSLRIARSFGKTEGVFFAEDYALEYTLSSIESSNKKRFSDAVLGEIIKGPESQKHMLIDSLRTYFKNDKNVKTTSEQLFIHRNTLTARLKRIEKLTGYTPWKFNDSCVLKTALILLQLELDNNLDNNREDDKNGNNRCEK